MAMDISWQTYRSLFLIFQNTISFDFERKTSYIASRVGGSICVRSWIERHNDACQASTVTCHEKELRKEKWPRKNMAKDENTKKANFSSIWGRHCARQLVRALPPSPDPPQKRKRKKNGKLENPIDTLQMPEHPTHSCLDTEMRRRQMRHWPHIILLYISYLFFKTLPPPKNLKK